MPIRFAALCLALALIAPTTVVAEPLPSVAPDRVGLATAPLAEIDALMQSFVSEGKLAGIVMLVARDGKVAHAGVYGQMDIEAGRPMRRDALFRIYSMTKPITGVALMTLYDEGRFELDDPVAKYLPGFDKVKVFAGEDGGTVKLADLKRPMTVRDLMCHTAGLAYGLSRASPVDEMYKEAKLLDRTKNLDSMLERLLKIPLAAQPGEKWMYSIAVDVQGKLIEALSGKPLDEFFAERVFKPLAMHGYGVLRAGRQARSPDGQLRQEGGSSLARRWRPRRASSRPGRRFCRAAEAWSRPRTTICDSRR